MHLLVTDHVTCPQCGPAAGLILLAEQMVERRILEGWLGCPSCQQKFRISSGLAKLLAGDAGSAAPASGHEPPSAVHVAALLGVPEGPGMVLLVGELAETAEEVADLVTDVEVLVATPYANVRAERPGVSRLQVGSRLPLRDRSMRGVAVHGSGLAMLPEAARVCALAGRVAVWGANAEARSALTSAGMHVAAEEGETLLAVRRA